jgi:hypothetical protein
MDFTPVSQQVYKFIYQYNVLKEASGKQVAWTNLIGPFKLPPYEAN